jgi:hypothetical protein
MGICTFLLFMKKRRLTDSIITVREGYIESFQLIKEQILIDNFYILPIYYWMIAAQYQPMAGSRLQKQ